ncbi:MAG: peptide-methionine (R)-S-oxide reductase MsrB [Ezakiella sp.]|nr:peptide-methionine (R)-S-oxide reductase MsrB [Ezakiella sp.]
MQMENENIKSIYLAGGCFWGVEAYFDRIDGVVEAINGYANGKSEETGYSFLKITDHAETVKIDYDFSKISLAEILLHYFRIIDPTSVNKQGNDEGRQYRTGIYYTSSEDLATILKIYGYYQERLGTLAVEVEELRHFIVAEEYHQDYLIKNPSGYCHVNLYMADEPLFDEKYNNPSDEELKNILDELSYDIMRNSHTERPGTSEFNDENRRGIYVDKITGEPLFTSNEKFDAGCGWPSFTRPILKDNVKYHKDNSFNMRRTEVRSKSGDNHLGHVFQDGPIDRGGLRYCINGAALRFIPYDKMVEEGYGDYLPLV